MSKVAIGPRDRLKYAVLIMSILLLSLTWGIGNSIRKTGTGHLAVQSSLLNAKYVDTVTRITIGQQELEKRTGSGIGNSDWYWFDPATDDWYLADSTKVSRFLTLLSATGSFTVAAEDQKGWNALGVGIGQGQKVIIRGKDDTVFSSLVFGITDATGTHIAVRSERKDTVYLVSDRYSEILCADSDYWSNTLLFPRIAEGAASSILWETAGHSYRFYSGEEKYDGVLQVLASLSGGRLLKRDTAGLDTSEKILSGTVSGVEDRWELSLFKTEEGQYIAECLSPYGKKTVVLSAWTASRLLNLID